MFNVKHPRADIIKKWISNKDASVLKEYVKPLTMGGSRSTTGDLTMSLEEMAKMLEESTDEEL